MDTLELAFNTDRGFSLFFRSNNNLLRRMCRDRNYLPLFKSREVLKRGSTVYIHMIYITTHVVVDGTEVVYTGTIHSLHCRGNAFLVVNTHTSVSIVIAWFTQILFS